MEDSKNLDTERQFLIDYTISHGTQMQDHIGYVVDYLHGNLPFIDMLKHAKNLPNIIKESARKYENIPDLVKRLTGEELLLVRKYFISLGAYITGQSFDTVEEEAKQLSFSKPIPDTARIPKDSIFYKGPPGKTLGDMREEV